jgi:uronate dehydrogenase
MDTPRILLTGAAGLIGQVLLADFVQRYRVRAFDRRPTSGCADAVQGDLLDLPCLRAAMEGVDVLVHLAAQAHHDYPFAEEILPNNVLGLYHAFEAAREAGVRRIVFASSCQAVLQYPPEHTVRVSDPARPETLYGAAKVFGEVAGRYYHDHFGMEFVGVRIGAYRPYDHPYLSRCATSRRLWLSPGDAVRLFRCAIDRPDVGYAVVFGASHTDPQYLSLDEARDALGYVPEDRVPALVAAE